MLGSTIRTQSLLTISQRPNASARISRLLIRRHVEEKEKHGRKYSTLDA